MIKRFIEVKNLGRFECLKSANGSEGEFARVNVVYALNACGKTTLCDLFRTLDTQVPDYVLGRKRVGQADTPSFWILEDGNAVVEFEDGHFKHDTEHPRIFVYDQRFIADNVFIGDQIGVEQKRNVYGLALGQKAVELNHTVQEAGDNLAKATTVFSQADTVLRSLVPNGYSIDSFRVLEEISDVEEQIASIKNRILIETSKKNKADQIRRHALLKKISVPIISFDELEKALATSLDDAALTAES